MFSKNAKGLSMSKGKASTRSFTAFFFFGYPYFGA